MTLTDVLKVTVNNLENIRIPVSMVDEIGIPLKRSIGNLQECIKAIEMGQQKPTEENAEQTDSGDAPDEA